MTLAARTRQTHTTASGSADAEGTAQGAALAVNIADDNLAEIIGNLIAAGAVSVSATTTTISAANAIVSAQGGETGEEPGAADSKIDGLKDHAAGLSGEAIPDSPAANSPEGPTAALSVAGALAVNIQTSHTHATLADAGNVNAGGLVQLLSVSQADASADADGSAVASGESGSTGVGAAAAINVGVVSNEASIGARDCR